MLRACRGYPQVRERPSEHTVEIIPIRSSWPALGDAAEEFPENEPGGDGIPVRRDRMARVGSGLGVQCSGRPSGQDPGTFGPLQQSLETEQPVPLRPPAGPVDGVDEINGGISSHVLERQL